MRIIKGHCLSFLEVINQTISVLKSGGLVVFPSDTVYGLLVDAKSSEAVTKLLKLKERVPGKAISVFVADRKMAEEYVEFTQNTTNVVENLLPGPFTVVARYRDVSEVSQVSKVSKGNKRLVDLRLLAENGTLGFRIPDYPLILDLVKKFGSPLTATSANLSGKSPHYSTNSLLNCLSKKKLDLIDLIIDAGELPHHQPSTVVDTTTGQLKTLRIGDFLPETAQSLISRSEEETKQLGRFLGAKFVEKTAGKPIIFLLSGELGAGKTIFTKGLAEAIGIKENVVSPTYTISYEYPLPLSTGFDINNPKQKVSFLVHYDLYRVESSEELAEIEFLKNLACGNVYVVEWSERIPKEMISALKHCSEIVAVQLQHSGPEKRIIKWSKI